MAFDDLRSFLQALDDQGQLLKISEEVNAEPDLAAAANATVLELAIKVEKFSFSVPFPPAKSK